MTDSRQAARYRRLMRYRGHKEAVVAVAHTILGIIYRLLKDRVSYMETWGPRTSSSGIGSTLHAGTSNS